MVIVAFALILDYIIIGLVLLLVWIISAFLAFQINPSSIFSIGSNRLSQWIWAIQSITTFTIYAGYFVILETLWQGQTLGKKWTKN